MEQVGSPLLVDGLGWIDNSGKELVRRRGWRALAVGLLGLVSFAGGFYLVQGTAGPGAPQVPWGVALIIVGFLTFPAGLTLSFSRSGYLSRLAGIPDRVRVEET
ncbi:MAG TPA: hypothetical protein VN842_04415, partial [Thermoplasmata archaeon]|nr:hypothetical protein [Thermoplasmata archaeon]